MIKHDWVKISRGHSPDVELYQCSVCKEIARTVTDYEMASPGNFFPKRSSNWDENCDIAIVHSVMES